MTFDQAALVLWLQLATITASILVAWRTLRPRPGASEPLEERSRRSLRERGWAMSVPMLTWIAPFVLWDEARHAPGGASPAFARWMFAVAWTSYLVASFVIVWLIARRRCADRPDSPTPRTVLRTGLALGAWFSVAPLVAAWLAILFSTWMPWTASFLDPTDALCFAAGSLLASWVTESLWTGVRRSSTAAPESVVAELRAALGVEPTAEIVVGPLVRTGLPQAAATEHRGRRWILVDRWVLDSLDADERTAILLHETGHLELDHVRIRGHLNAMCYLVVLVVATASGWGSLTVLVAAVCLVRQFVLLPLYRRQELQADAFAARRGHAAGLSRALARLHDENGLPKDFGRSRGDMTHPDLVRRQQALAVPSEATV